MKQLIRAAIVMAVAVLTCGCAVDRKTQPEPIRNVFNESTDSWLIQYNSDMGGDQRVYLAPDKAKFEVKNMGTSIVLLQQPTPTVFVFNDPKRVLYNAPIPDWQKQREELITSLEPTHQRSYTTFERGTEDTKIFGLDARHYVGSSITSGQRELKIDLWLTSQIKAPPELFDFVNQHSKGLPEGGVPLRMVVSEGGKQHVSLDTIKAIKMNVPDSVFAIPIGYTVVSSEMEVVKSGMKGPAKPGQGSQRAAGSSDGKDNAAEDLTSVPRLGRRREARQSADSSPAGKTRPAESESEGAKVSKPVVKSVSKSNSKTGSTADKKANPVALKKD